jgi:chromosome segregation ATPase
MSKSKALIAAEAKIAALEAHNAEAEQHITELMGRIAALEARISVAKNVYLNQKARIAELEAALNTRGVKAVPAAPSAEPAAPIVSYYTDRCGRVWEKIRVGNNATSRPTAQIAAH